MPSPWFTPRTSPAYARPGRRPSEHGTPADQFMRIRRADGVERWVRVRTVPDLAADGTVVKVYGTMIDDTERVETERIRRAAETRFEIIFEQSEIGAVIVDLEGRPDSREQRDVPDPRAGGGRAHRPAMDQLQPSRRSPARPGRAGTDCSRTRHVCRRTTLRATRREDRLGFLERFPRSGRIRSAPVLLGAVAGHHRSEGDRARAGASGAPRRPHRAAEPCPPRRSSPARPGELASARRPPRRDVPGHRRVQDDQRLLRPSHRRRSVASCRGTHRCSRSERATPSPGSAATSSSWCATT